MKKDYDSTRIYRNTQKKGCVTDLWHTLNRFHGILTEWTGRGCSPTDFTDLHRWCVFGILWILCVLWDLPRPQWICVNLCNLWEDYFLPSYRIDWQRCPPTDFTDSHRWCVFGVLWILCVLWDLLRPQWICENLCNLWEDYFLPSYRIDWQRVSSHRIHRIDWQRCPPTDFTLTFSLWYSPTDFTLSLQKKAIRLNNRGKTMIAKDSFVPLL